MFRESNPVQTLRRWRNHWKQRVAAAFGWRSASSAAIFADVGARVCARAGLNRLTLVTVDSEPGAPGLAPFETWALAAHKLTMRIRVCLQAYRNALKRGSALAAGWRLPKDETMVPSQALAQHLSRLGGAEAAALIEFAVALPLLVVLVVGIFDFGGAFNLKQELNNAVREGARFASTQPTNDLVSVQPPPPSVEAVRFLVDSYLQTAKINDCGLGLSSTTGILVSSLSWKYAPAGCSLTLDIVRGVAVQETVGGAPVNMLCTTVTISYPYQWHFNSVIQLLVPGANYTFTNITSNATAVNMN